MDIIIYIYHIQEKRMISIKPLRVLLAERDMNFSELTKGVGMSTETINRLKKGMPVSITTIDNICRFMKCEVKDVIEYAGDKYDKHEAV